MFVCQKSRIIISFVFLILQDLPGATELLDASGYSFSVSDLLRMERVILAKLDWDLNAVTPLSFLQAVSLLLYSIKGLFLVVFFIIVRNIE